MRGVGASEAAFRWTASDFVEVEENLQDELSSRWMYQSLAQIDPNPERAALLRKLAEYEERHANLWRSLLERLGRRPPRERRSLNHRILVGMARTLGVGLVLPIVHREEVDGVEKYRDQARRWQDPVAKELFREILPDEIAHEIETSQAAREVGSKGGSLRSLLLGAIDGFASVVALAAGVAAVTRSDLAVLIAGAAAVAAGALSMAASEYVSVKAERDARTAQIEMEREAFKVAPGSKKRQLVQAYQVKGLTLEESERVVGRLEQDPGQFLHALLAERYGSDDNGEQPGRQGFLTGISFALAGAVPIVPFLVLSIPAAVIASVAVTGIALFVAGLFRALSSLHPFLRSGLEMVAVGMGAAAGTYLIGLLIGGVVG